MLIVALDVGIVTRDLGEGAHPEVVGEGQDVGLGDEGDLPLFPAAAVGGGQAAERPLLAAAAGQLEGEADARSTPGRVLIEVWIATSSGVPFRVNPPAPT